MERLIHNNAQEAAREDESSGFSKEEYIKEVKETKKQQDVAEYKNDLLASLYESGALLEKSHPFYNELEDIIHVLKPGCDVDLYISLEDSARASTLLDNQTIILSYGFIQQLHNFVLSRFGSGLKKGHLALLMAHELSHWDEDANIMHVNENYCDTNGLLNAAKHYNLQNILETFYFLEQSEDEAREAGIKSYPSITHPSSENRINLAEAITTDPTIHLAGRAIEPEELVPEHLQNLFDRGSQWVEHVRSRIEIASMDDITREYEHASTLSELIEVFYSADRFAFISQCKRLADSDMFYDITLGLALHASRDNLDISIEMSDMFNAYLAEKITELPAPDTTSERTATRLNAKRLTKRDSLIGDCLNGTYPESQKMLFTEGTELSKYGKEFSGCDLNTFFTLLTESINKYLQNDKRKSRSYNSQEDEVDDEYSYPHNDEQEPDEPEETYNQFRAAALGFSSLLNSDDYQITEELSDDEKRSVIENRTRLFEQVKYAIASNIMRKMSFDTDSPSGYAYEDDEGTDWLYDKKLISSIQKRFESEHSRNTIDYNLHYQLLKKHLLEKNICQTEEVAHDLSILIISNGSILESSFLTSQCSIDADYLAVDSTNDDVLSDLAQFFTNESIALVNGGDGLKWIIPPFKSFSVNETIQNYYEIYGSRKQELAGTRYSPYELIFKTKKLTVGGAFQKKFGFWNSVETEFAERKLYGTDDLDMLQELFLRPLEPNMRRKILLTETIKTNEHFIRELLHKGIERRLLMPEDIMEIVYHSGSMKLHQEFLPYISDLLPDMYYANLLAEQISKATESENTESNVLQALFAYIEQGGVLDFTYNRKYADIEREKRKGTYNDDITIVQYRHILSICLPNKTDIGMSVAPGDSRELSLAEDELRQLAEKIVSYSLSENCVYTDEIRDRMLGTACKLKVTVKHMSWGKKYTSKSFLEGEVEYAKDDYLAQQSKLEQVYDDFEKIDQELLRHYNVSLSDNENEPSKPVMFLVQEKKTIDTMFEMIVDMPECTYRDELISLCEKYMRSSSSKHYQENVQRLTRLFSRDLLQRYDLINDNQSAEDQVGSAVFSAIRSNRMSPLRAFPLVEGATDASLYYPFLDKRVGLFLPDSVFGESFGFLSRLRTLTLQKGEDGTERSMREKLQFAIDCFSNPSTLKDALIESVFYHDVVLNDAGISVDQETLQLAWKNAYSDRTKDLIGQHIVEQRLMALVGSSFQDKLSVILEYFPTGSSLRDRFLNKIANESTTTWDEIAQVEEKLLGYKFGTGSKDRALRNVAYECVSEGIKMMTPKERTELLLFLFDSRYHISRPEELTEDYFSDKIKVKLGQDVVGKHDYTSKKSRQKVYDDERDIVAVSNTDYEENYITIRDYLIAKHKGDPIAASIGDSMPAGLRRVVDTITYERIAQYATPNRINDLVTKFYVNKEDMGLNSFGKLFMYGEESDRRMLIFRICGGDNGLFTDQNYDQHGAPLLQQLVEVITQDKLSQGSTDGEHLLTRDEVTIMQKVLTSAFKHLTPKMRAETLARVLNLYTKTNGAINKEDLIVVGLSAYRALGPKLAQLDVLWPPELQKKLSTLKEAVPPLPKATIAQIMMSEGRGPNYHSLGPNGNGGSIGCVLTGDTPEGTSRIIKIYRPDIPVTLEDDLQALLGTLNDLKEQGVIDVDPSHIVEQIAALIREETHPTIEAVNTRMLATLFRSRDINISVPQIVYAGERILEMTTAEGISLSRVRDIQNRYNQGEQISEEDMLYVETDVREISRQIFDSYCYQAFVLGIFHTDLQSGNVFVSEQGQISQIDHGQVGVEDDVRKRQAMLTVSLGLVSSNAGMIAAGLKEYAPDVSIMEIFETVRSSDNLMVGILGFLEQKRVQGSINRYIKGFMNIVSHINYLPPSDIVQVMLKYSASKQVVQSAIKALPLSIQQIQEGST
ncbi:MAG: AarF/UbiB family protein [Patescibacteria group bacterium]